MKIRNLILALTAFAAIISCKAPQASEKTIITVKHDTLITKEIHKDSVIHNIFSRDTVVIRENRLTIKYAYKGGSNAFIGGTVLPDTVIKVYRDTLKQTTIIKLQDKPLSAFDQFSKILTLLILIAASVYFGTKYLAPLLKNLMKL